MFSVSKRIFDCCAISATWSSTTQNGNWFVNEILRVIVYGANVVGFDCQLGAASYDGSLSKMIFDSAKWLFISIPKCSVSELCRGGRYVWWGKSSLFWCNDTKFLEQGYSVMRVANSVVRISRTYSGWSAALLRILPLYNTKKKRFKGQKSFIRM